MPLPSSLAAIGTASNRRSRRTPAADSNTPAAGSLLATPALVASTSIVPGVQSGSRTIRHAAPPTPPAALDHQPLAAQRMLRRGHRHLRRQRRGARFMQSVRLVVSDA